MWWFVLVASAQQELCELIPPSVLDARLARAAAALAEARVDEARFDLRVARDEARCLDAPIAPAQLSRLAWLHAEHAVFNQDSEDLWRWVRLARDTVPSSEPGEHVAEDHPLRRLLAQPPTLPDVVGPDRVLAHPRRGGVYVDGVRLDRPLVRAETPHLVQVFSNREWIDAHWQSGSRFREELLADPTRVVEVVAVDDVDVDAPVGPAKWKPAKKDTVAAWEKWILANPTSEWIDEARGRLDDCRFRDAQRAGDAAIRAYLADDPGRNARAARAALERVEFDRAADENTRQAWQIFLGRHPDGVYQTEAAGRLDALAWDEARKKDTEEAYARYLTQQRDGARREEARVLLAERVWEAAVASGDPGALRLFANRFPTSPRRTEARALLAGTRFGAVQVAVDGSSGLEQKLLEAVGVAGLRGEAVAMSAGPPRVAEGNALLRVAVRNEGGRWRADAALWTVLAGSALAAWSAEADDEEGLIDAVARGLPDLARWR